jgi:hypothetical protein
MKFWKWLCRHFCSVQVTGYKPVNTLVEAAAQEYHAAIWGNVVTINHWTGLQERGRREVMAFRVSDPELLLSLTDRDKDRFEQQMRSVNFVWAGDLHVFHPTRVAGMTNGAIVNGALKVPLRSYYLQ